MRHSSSRTSRRDISSYIASRYRNLALHVVHTWVVKRALSALSTGKCRWWLRHVGQFKLPQNWQFFSFFTAGSPQLPQRDHSSKSSHSSLGTATFLQKIGSLTLNMTWIFSVTAIYINYATSSSCCSAKAMRWESVRLSLACVSSSAR